MSTGLAFCLLTGMAASNPGGSKAWLESANAAATVLAETGTDVGPGVFYRSVSALQDGSPEKINYATVDLTNQYIKLRGAAPNDRAIGLESVTSQALRHNSPGDTVVAAVNGDFFYLKAPAGLPIGMLIRDGEVVSGPSVQPVFGVTNSGEPFIGNISMSTQVYTVGETVYAHKADSVNRRRLTDNLVVYTPSFGPTTNTNNLGTELIVTGLETPIKPNTQYIGTVAEKRIGVGNSAIPADGVVISGHGSAANFLNGFQNGQQIGFSITLNRSDVQTAVGGMTRLVIDGKAAPASELNKRSDASSRQPRTAVGIRGNTVMIVTVDGRQPGVSVGMTLEELAQYLLSMGAEQALNFDGGGSTTFAVRQQGDALVSLANRPSDGKERPIATSLQVVSTAPLGELAHLKVRPMESSKIFVRSKEKFVLRGMDEFYNPIDVGSYPVEWSVQGEIGTVDQQGIFTAGDTAGSGEVTATANGVTVSVPITVVDSVAGIAVYPNPVIVQPGASSHLTVLAWDETNSTVTLNTSGVVWSEQGGTGAIDAAGLYTAGDKVKEGQITATVGDKSASVKVYTGRPPVVLEDFEDISGWQAAQLKAATWFGVSGKSEPFVNGYSSGKLIYNFKPGGKVQTGTSASYAALKTPLTLEGRPLRIGLWAYGDGKGHWLRGILRDAKGNKNYLEFTSDSGVNWTGWKYVTAEVSTTAPLPLKLESIYVAESRTGRKDTGTIFLDDLTAEYTVNTEGMIPTISVLIPGPNGTSQSVDIPIDQSYNPGNGKKLVVLDLNSIKLTVSDQNKVSLYKILDQGGRKIQLTKYNAEKNTLQALVDGLGQYTIVENDPGFTDVTQTSRYGWAKRDIEIMAAKEIVQGRGNSLFYPEKPVTRAEFLAMLVRAIDLKVDSTKPVSFKDVRNGDWYLETVRAAVVAGLTKGYDDGTFKPDRQISRLEMAMLLSRAAKLKGGDTAANRSVLAQYKDAADLPDWAVADVSFAVKAGLIQGKQANRLAFDDQGTRAEATVLIKRFFDKFL